MYHSVTVLMPFEHQLHALINNNSLASKWVAVLFLSSSRLLSQRVSACWMYVYRGEGVHSVERSVIFVVMSGNWINVVNCINAGTIVEIPENLLRNYIHQPKVSKSAELDHDKKLRVRTYPHTYGPSYRDTNIEAESCTISRHPLVSQPPP